jgi:hypothetical protein
MEYEIGLKGQVEAPQGSHLRRSGYRHHAPRSKPGTVRGAAMTAHCVGKDVKGVLPHLWIGCDLTVAGNHPQV